MGELSYTVGGDSNLVSFKSAARVPITSLKAHFKPKQDLHGYSKPWPAGGGKNLITSTEYSGDFYTNQTGIDLKKIRTYASFVENDNNITVNTTADWYGCIFATKLLPVGDYKVYLTVDANFRGAVFITDDDLIVTQVWQYSGSGINQTVTLSEPSRIAVYIGCGAARSTVTSDLQVESGTSYTGWEPYENICPIEGWSFANITRTGKNIAQVIKYRARGGTTDELSNSYGTTINTVAYNSPDTPLIITQSQAPDTATKASFQNGYFTIWLNNLQYNKYYDVSFKVSNIKSNPLNTKHNELIILVNGNGWCYCSQVINDTVVFKNVRWRRYSEDPSNSNYNDSYFEIRNCGMSFTLSEFMVTEANTNDGVFEPYCGEVIPVTFPITGKNLCNAISGNDIYYTGGIGYGRYIIENGSVITNGGTLMGFKTPCIPNTTYTFSFTSTYIGGNLAVRVYETIDEPTVFPEGSSVNKWSSSIATFTTKENTKWLVVGMYVDPTQGTEGVTISNFMLNLGSTKETYEPYSSDNTYYGGYIDPAVGEAQSSWYLYTITGNEEFLDDNNANAWVSAFVPTGLQASNEASLIQVGYCTHYPYKAYTRGSIGVMYNERTITFDASIRDAAGWKAFCKAEYEKGTPVQICYPLKSYSQFIPINKNNIITFIDVNNIWSNTNDITEVSYAIHDTAPIRAAKKRMAAENDKHYRKVLWNQILPDISSDYWTNFSNSILSTTFENGIATSTFLDSTNVRYSASVTTKNLTKYDINHKYYISYMVKSTYPNSFGVEFAMGQQYSTITGLANVSANEWCRGSCISYPRNSGTSQVYIPFPYASKEGEGFQVKVPILIDLTAMFGLGNEPTREEFEKLCVINNIDLTVYHPIDSGTEQIWCIPDHNTDEYITVNWNQQCKTLATSNYKPQNSNYVSISAENGVMTTTILQDISEVYQSSFISNYSIEWNSTHQYYYKQEINSSTNSTYYLIYKSRRGAYQTLPSNTWTTLEAIASPESTDFTPIFLAYNVDKAIGGVAGASCQVRNPILIDLTQMFGAGNEPATVAELRETCLKNNINLDEAQPYTTSSTIIWKK